MRFKEVGTKCGKELSYVGGREVVESQTEAERRKAVSYSSVGLCQ